MSDRFPYDLPSRDALVRLIQETTQSTITAETVTFEDMFFAPLQSVPGRTYIEMINTRTQRKEWYVFRRLDIKKVFGDTAVFRLMGRPSPASIAIEINRALNMQLGPDDISFSTALIELNGETVVKYMLRAMTGSYAYYGEVEITLEILSVSPYARVLEDGGIRLNENGGIRELEHEEG